MPPLLCTILSRPTAALRTGIDIRRFTSAAEAKEEGWDTNLTLPPFLSAAWLASSSAAAQGGAGGPVTDLIQVRDGGQVVLQTILQELPVDSMRLGDRVDPTWVARALGPTAFQIGQALFSGPAVATALPSDQTAALLTALAQDLPGRGACFLKDLPSCTAPGEDWIATSAMPEMAICIPSAWCDFNDYLAALPSKYRSRVRRARSKFAGLESRELTADDAERFGESLQSLYADLMARTPYAPFVVEAGYVARLKALRPDEVLLRGYFDGERMVGFSTLLVDGREGLAHLAAVAPAYNPSHQLYLNVLFDLLASAIERGCSRLNYGRTATTIKSSVGAAPVGYASFVRHSGRLRQQLLKQLVPRVAGDADRDARIQRPLG